MKKCPICGENMRIVRKKVEIERGCLYWVAVILFFPISLLFVLVDMNNKKEVKTSMCISCGYEEEIE